MINGEEDLGLALEIVSLEIIDVSEWRDYLSCRRIASEWRCSSDAIWFANASGPRRDARATGMGRGSGTQRPGRSGSQWARSAQTRANPTLVVNSEIHWKQIYIWFFLQCIFWYKHSFVYLCPVMILVDVLNEMISPLHYFSTEERKTDALQNK